MALTVRPDDEVYQFDTVWLGPDEYTLPIQARYVAWGTWLACFLVAAVVLVPIGGDGPGSVFGSLIWALGLSVVLSRAVMLVVDHERPLRSLPALFSSEARAALAARRRAERALLVRPGKIRVRETPPKVLAMRERQRSRSAVKADRRRPAPVEAPAEVAVAEPAWIPDEIEYAEPVPAWSVPVDARDDDVYSPVPVTYGAAYPATPHVTAPEPVPAPEPYGYAEPTPRNWQAAPANGHAPHEVVAAVVAPRGNPFRTDPHHPDDSPYRGPVTVSPTDGRHARASRDEAADGQAAIEARILLPARKDR